MDKNAIKKYAVWARRELIERVTQRAMLYGITAKDVGDPNAESVNGRLLSKKEATQRQALIRRIQEKGFDQVVEEVAYTWFNRFAALRFMEINGYLPSHVRVFTNDAGEFKPQILDEAINLELDGLDEKVVYELESANRKEELFKYLLIVQCNALNSILPGMFQRIDDYTELLLPDFLLREGSVIEQMVTMIPKEDWKDQVQIIGWLYEAYNTELNSIVYDGSFSKDSIPKELLPAATTFYTPDWPVHYMVENSLGRLWLEGHPSEKLKSEWKYYLDEANQREEVQIQLDAIREEYANISPEEIRVLDPCMGSGHILCVLFDVLVRIYENYGYTASEASIKILEKNIWGLDIDKRAAQLSYFAVMMKARQYDRRFFSRKVQPHVYSIKESNDIDSNFVHCLGVSLTQEERNEAIEQTLRIINEMCDAKEYGSIIKISQCDWDLLRRFASTQDVFGQTVLAIEMIDKIRELIDVAEALSQKYDVVVTNPPYLGSNRFSPSLSNYVKKYAANAKADLSMVMYKHAIDSFVKRNGFVAFITTSSWLFLSSFEKLRRYVAEKATLASLVDFGTELFDGKVGHNPIVSWVIRNSNIKGYALTAVRLIDYCYSRRNEKEVEFFNAENRYITDESNFLRIPGAPIAYWASESLCHVFERENISDYGFAGIGMRTGDNARFLRLWYEVVSNNILLGCSSREEQIASKRKWIPYNKGGDYRKWYGNNEYIVNWRNDGKEIKENTRLVYPYLGDNLGWKISNESYYYRPGITWSGVTSSKNSFRLYEEGFIFDSGANGFFPNDESLRYTLLACLNSCISQYILNIINPTINTGVGTVNIVPVILPTDKETRARIDLLSRECVFSSRSDWDSFETSWDFQEHPFISSIRLNIMSERPTSIQEAFKHWQFKANARFLRIKENEEELNSLFINAYGLEDELSPEVSADDISVRKADLQRDVRSFISYAVGCMFGRYTMGNPGLIYAGGEWDESKYPQYQPDKDGIIPISDDEYFEDDVVARFVKFVEIAFGADTLEENLDFIAKALGGKGSSRAVIRNYFIKGFYDDHLKVYQKRPIYWLFDSGKKNAFKCLIYMHRYQPDTLARIRTDYIHEQQSRYQTEIVDLEKRIDSATGSERAKLTKQLETIRGKAEELRAYEEKIHHLADQMIEIDLDDGVKHNYALFKDVLAKIK